jgi:hypothetical protein
VNKLAYLAGEQAGVHADEKLAYMLMNKLAFRLVNKLTYMLVTSWRT